MRVVCVIPARLKSTRFPKKMLAPLLGKPLLQWVWEAACKVDLFDEVAVAVDSQELAEAVARFGGKPLLTSETCATGTDRLIELCAKGSLKADVWVNWQGDEPFINAQMVRDLLQSCAANDADIWTLKKKIVKPEELASPHICKVVTDQEGYGLYFSRYPIPYVRDGGDYQFYKHVGMYAFRDTALQKFAHLKPCALEEAEQLEMLRFLFHGFKVRVHETQEEPFGIDLPEHLAKAETVLKASVS